MKFKTSTVLSIAEKEFADHVRNPVFILTAATFVVAVLAWTYVKGTEVAYVANTLGMPDLMRGFKGMGSVVGQFVPLLGIITCFETLTKEIKTGSMNVLMTHPVYRDNIILGKLLGSGMIIFLILFLSINIATGVLLASSGLSVTPQQIIRLELFVILTFFYAMIFSGIALIISILVKKQNASLFYSLIVWLFVTIFFSQIVFTLLYETTKDFELADSLRATLLNLVPGHHYAAASVGLMNVFSSSAAATMIQGIFDTAYTLSDWFIAFLPNLIVLLGAPVILISIAVSLFLRRDVTL